MTTGIYRLYNKVTGKSYIGKSKNIENRIRDHLRMLRKNTQEGSYGQMLADYKEYGKESFVHEILEECSYEQLSDREGYWAYQFDVFNPKNGYNIHKRRMPSYEKYVREFATPEEKKRESAMREFFANALGSNNPINPLRK